MDRVISDLLDITTEQSENIHKLTDIVVKLNEEVQSRPTKTAMKKIVLGLVIAFSTLAVALNYASFRSGQSTLSAIEDCTTINGECYSLQARETTIVRGQISCNQEKVAYYLKPSIYVPLTFCSRFINHDLSTQSEQLQAAIPRLDVVGPQVPLLDSETIYLED